MQPIPVPPPFGGMSDRVPVFALEAPFCEWLQDFNLTAAGAEMRNGDARRGDIVSFGASETFVCFAGWESESLVLFCEEATGEFKLNKQTSTTWSGVGSVVTGAAVSVREAVTSFFNGRLFFFVDDVLSGSILQFYYDGTTFAAATYASSAAPEPWLALGGCTTYKNRHYMPVSGQAAYYYSDIDAIAGTCTKVDLGSQISQPATLLQIARFSLADNVAAEAILAFIFSTGEVLFYSGSYPNSQDWVSVGSAMCGKPFRLDSGCQFNGDYVFATVEGPISLRDLFLKGSLDAKSLTLSANIADLWKATANAYQAEFALPVCDCLHEPNKQRLVFLMPVANEVRYKVSRTPLPGTDWCGFTWFIYDTEKQAWFIHQREPNEFWAPEVSPYGRHALFHRVAGQIRYLLKIASNQYAVVIKEQPGTSRDYAPLFAGGFSSIVPYIQLAPISIGRLYVAKFGGVDVILDGDSDDFIEYLLLRDLLGRPWSFGGVPLVPDASKPQKVPQGATDRVRKSFVNVGIEGSFVQLVVYGETDPANATARSFTVYGFNFWVEQGQMPR